MARRDESILSLLVESPWWVSVIVSAAVFVFLRFILPSIDFGSMAANAFAKGLSGAAPFVALVLYFLPQLLLLIRGPKGNIIEGSNDTHT